MNDDELAHVINERNRKLRAIPAVMTRLRESVRIIGTSMTETEMFAAYGANPADIPQENDTRYPRRTR